jgi:hypothetical protein
MRHAKKAGVALRTASGFKNLPNCAERWKCYNLVSNNAVFRVLKMPIEATVRDDGTLTIKVPDRYRGKKVHVSIREAEAEPTNQWEAISRIAQEVGRLGLPGRTHEEILKEIRGFRETE